MLSLAALGLFMVAAASLLLPLLDHGENGERLRFFGIWRTRHAALALVAIWALLVIGAWSRSVRVAIGLLMGTVATGITLLCLEGAGLALGVDWNAVLDGGRKMTLGHEAVPHLETEGIAHQDIALACRLDFERVPFRFRSDQRGFRNEVDRDSADIYLLGDSFIVAGLVPTADLVGTRLEQSLERSVMNVALSGISPQEERDLLLGSDLALDGRTVIHFVFEGNDLEDSARYVSGVAREPVPRSLRGRSLVTAVVVHLQRATKRWIGQDGCSIGFLDGEPYLFGWLRSSFEDREGQCQVIAETLLDTREEVGRRGGRYCVVLIPAKIRVLGPFCSWPPESTVSAVEPHLSPLRDYLVEWAPRNGVALLDLTDTLTRSVVAGRVPWFPGDTHWNSIGHEVAAAAVVQWLQAQPGGNPEREERDQ